MGDGQKPSLKLQQDTMLQGRFLLLFLTVRKDHLIEQSDGAQCSGLARDSTPVDVER
jgi:hypothetical protein